MHIIKPLIYAHQDHIYHGMEKVERTCKDDIFDNDDDYIRSNKNKEMYFFLGVDAFTAY